MTKPELLIFCYSNSSIGPLDFCKVYSIEKSGNFLTTEDRPIHNYRELIENHSGNNLAILDINSFYIKYKNNKHKTSFTLKISILKKSILIQAISGAAQNEKHNRLNSGCYTDI